MSSQGSARQGDAGTGCAKKRKNAAGAPAGNKKGKTDAQSLEEMRKVALSLSLLTKEQKETVEGHKNISDFTAGTIFELAASKTIKTGTGSAALAEYETVVEGKKTTGKLMIPARVTIDPEYSVPCLLIYLGQKQNKESQSYYDVKVTSYGTPREMKKAAADLRKKSPGALINQLTTKNLSHFDDGSVFILKEISTVKIIQDGKTKNAPVGVYEQTSADGGLSEGEVFLTERLASEAENALPVCVLYLGKKKSQSSPNYYHDARLIRNHVSFTEEPRETVATDSGADAETDEELVNLTQNY